MSELDDQIRYKAVYEGELSHYLSFRSRTWTSEKSKIDGSISRLAATDVSHSADFKRVDMIELIDYTEEVIQLVKQKNILYYRVKQLVEIVKHIKSSIIIDNLEMHCSEMQQAAAEIDEAVGKILSRASITGENLYLTDNERSIEKSTLVKMIFESIVYYLIHSDQNETFVIRQIISDCFKILKHTKVIEVSDEIISSRNCIALYLTSVIGLYWTQNKCTNCHNTLLSEINFCINCYENVRAFDE